MGYKNKNVQTELNLKIKANRIFIKDLKKKILIINSASGTVRFGRWFGSVREWYGTAKTVRRRLWYGTAGSVRRRL
ncbi:hypothetical protein BpHYR1_047053 [Brachionus plicatilis]|uniref:Uncharacterized protein n=1 Tax=Brachionus plicatilis TaxID=10195 RepID=A0A3M7RXR8_BRAPC|nr:hypothetical protein BpHYR1_047053 [Brachionus plicatilis]